MAELTDALGYCRFDLSADLSSQLGTGHGVSFIYLLALLVICGYITNSQCDSLIAQSCEHCTDIADDMG